MKSSQRGSAIIMLFVMVALFGAISYALLSGSKSNVGWLKNEQSKAAGTSSQDCTNAVTMATKRLQLRGCGSTISTATDGSNINAGAPTDGSCSIYHVNGGGVKPCASAAPSCNLATLAIGQDCSGIRYAGILSGRRLYIGMTEDNGSGFYNNGTYTPTAIPGAQSYSNGMANTNTLLAATGGDSPYQAAILCRGIGPKWYFPAYDEMIAILNNGTALGITSSAGYHTSTDPSSNYGNSANWFRDVWVFFDGSGGSNFGDSARSVTARILCAYEP